MSEAESVDSQAPLLSRPRFRFTIGLLVKLIVLCAGLGASIREREGLFTPLLGFGVALSILAWLKKEELGANGSDVPGWLACACIVVVRFSCYWFAPPP